MEEQITFGTAPAVVNNIKANLTTLADALEASNAANGVPETPLPAVVPQPAETQPAKPKKWTSTAGPRQSKQVQDALGKIRWEGQTYVELSGVKGRSEHRACFTQVFGGMREDASSALTELGERFGWQVTRDNCQDIINAALEVVAKLADNRPVRDNRSDPQEYDAMIAANQKAEQERQEKESRRQSRIQAKAYAIRDQFPWKQDKRSDSDHKWVGRNIRAELARVYPFSQFSVRTEYGRVNVDWEMGPTFDAVKALLDKYEKWTPYDERGHDSRSDEEKETAWIEREAIQRHIGSITHVFLHRSLPANGLAEQIGRLICSHLGREFKGLSERYIFEADGDQLSDHVWRLYNQTHFPAGSKIVGIKDAPTDNTDPHCHWVLDLEVILPTQSAPVAAELGSSASPSGIIVAYNRPHNGVEIKFPSKPERSVIDRVKSHGFRWSSRSGVWYKRYSDSAWNAAHQLAGIPVPTAPFTGSGPDTFDMAVEDRMAEQCGL